MDFEKLLLSKALQTGQVEKLLIKGVQAEYFFSEEHHNIFSYCVDHIQKYKSPPSLEAIKELYPDYRIDVVTDSFDFLIDGFIRQTKRKESIKGLRSIAKMIDNDPDGLNDIDHSIIELGSSISEMFPIGNSSKFSDMGKRIAAYDYEKENGTAMGIPFGIPTLDDKTLGIQPHEYISIVGWQGTGKALALDTLIPTPDGFTTQGELQVGDSIFDGQGKICKVRNVGAVLIDRPVRRVTFGNGEIVYADAAHEWVTRDCRGRVKIRETDEIMSSLHRKWLNGKTKNHSVESHGIELEERNDLPIEPYVLGVWLGGGDSDGGGTTISDREIINGISSARELRAQTPRPDRADRYTIIGLKPTLRRQSLLKNKHIPPVYLRASRKQRIELLTGLMDTDGYISEDGLCEFVNTNKKLMEGFYELICSLGYKSSGFKTSRALLYGKDCGPKYRIHFYPKELVFTVKRKLERYKVAHPRAHRVYITSVDKVSSKPVRCIEVDSKDGTYSFGKTMLPTHNSTLAQIINFSAYLAGYTPLIVSLEMEAQAIFRRFDVMATNFKYYALKKLELSDTDKEKWEGWAQRAETLSNDIIVIDDVSSCTLERVYAIARQYKPDLLTIDYVSLMDAPYKNKALWEAITDLTKGLKRIARDSSCPPVIGIAQTNIGSASDGARLANIAYSRSLGQDSDIVLGLYQDEDGRMKELKKMEVRLLKNRDGETTFANMYWDMERMIFREWKTSDMFAKPQGEEIKKIGEGQLVAQE